MRKRSKGPKTPTYDVGRGRPPKRTRFKRGKSGNPRGRPKGAKNLATLLREAAQASTPVRIAGKLRRTSALHATVMQLATKAAKGDRAATNKFLDWIDEIESREAANARPVYPLGPADVDVIRAVHRRMLECEEN